MHDYTRSKAAFAKAKEIIPGGVNSPVRAFKSVGGDPVFFASGSGARVTDIDGNTYIDYVGSWGPLILGHAHAPTIAAVRDAAGRGTSFGAPTPGETELAELIIKLVPSIEKVRLVNSGTEATMSAIRAARGFTGRELIMKFEGCYHGHADGFLIAAGSGATTLGIPDSKGVTRQTAASTLIAPFNDLAAVKRLFNEHGKEIAAVIVEPVAGNMGVVPPAPGFLQGLKECTAQHGAVLIFDEVMTGFRVAPGGAQELYGVKPDMTTLGKIIGGGLPVGAYGGRRDIMDMIAPVGPVYQAGTLSGNPLAVAGGLSMLKVLSTDNELYKRLETRSSRLAKGLADSCKRAAIPHLINRVGSMVTLFFTSAPAVTDYTTAKTSDTAFFTRYFRAALDRGIYLPPSQFEAFFVSDAHGDAEIDETIGLLDEALRTAKA